MTTPTTVSMSEAKDQLSRLVAEIEATGSEVHLTRHGRVVARIAPAEPSGVVFGTGAKPGVDGPDLEDFRWSEDDLDAMLGGVEHGPL